MARLTHLPDLSAHRPFREGTFSSPLHSERVAAILGIALGVSFSICFATGLYSHFAQHPPTWFELPARPAGLYRVTQGLHVATGIATIPILLAKLWVIYPKLFRWPPFTNVANVVERVSLLPLIAGGLFMLGSGLANINLWYPWKFSFPVTHYWVAWITMGALVVHVGAKRLITLRALRPSRPAEDPADPPFEAEAAAPGVLADRRGFLAGVFATSGLLTLVTVGQTFSPLAKLALLSPRRPDVGPQGFPVNRTARTAGVLESARSPDYRFVVDGKVARPLSLTVHELRAMDQHSAVLPISCVEGWSSSQHWTGVRMVDLLHMAGAAPGASVTVHSLQPHRSYRTSDVNEAQSHDRDTLLALRVGGEELDIDHGYPVRLIGPDRPGVMQTKWVTRVEVR
ncbi:MAG TPA: molybdopterin-dependent oxidoreductase [Acidimicrobiia bacterium]|jgi:DMSO/TMAO reductase YedYZ molybdopterin-dependent catalytic subunit